MERYIIAVRRDARETVPPDWSEKLGQIEDLTILGPANAKRVQVQASEEAIDRARRLLGDYCHIEPAIYHQTSSL